MMTGTSTNPAKTRTPQQVKTMACPFDDDAQLNQGEDGWGPCFSGSNSAKGDQAHKTEELLRKVRSILNKVTPEKFEPLMDQVMELTVDTEEKLKGVVDLVFQRAVDEPNFSELYGRMCHRLASMKVQMTEKPDGTVSFQTLLLSRCQKVLQGDRAEDALLARKKRELDAATLTSECRRLKQELEDAGIKARGKLLGCAKFIGELFKGKMLTSAIVHNCLSELLEKENDNSLQALCTLLNTVGKDLDVGDSKPLIDQLFSQIEKLVAERKTSNRIRFMLEDVVTLRAKLWVPRRAGEGPKTIQQVRREAEKEEQEEQRKVNQQLFSRDSRRPTDTFTAPRYERGQARTTAPEMEPRRTNTFRQNPDSSKPRLDGEVPEWRRRNEETSDGSAPTKSSWFNVRERRYDKMQSQDQDVWMKFGRRNGDTRRASEKYDVQKTIKKKVVPLNLQDHEKWPTVGTGNRPANISETTAKDDVQKNIANKQQVDDQVTPPPQPQTSWAAVCKKASNTSNEVKPKPVAKTQGRPAVSKENFKKNVTVKPDAVQKAKDDKTQSKVAPLIQQNPKKLPKVDKRNTDANKAGAKNGVQKTNDNKQQVDDQIAPPPQPQTSCTEVCKKASNTSDEVKPKPVAKTQGRPAVSKENFKKNVTVKPDDVQKAKDDKQQVDVQIAPPSQPQTTCTEASTAKGHSEDEVKPKPVTKTPNSAALSEERIERKSRAIIDEFLHIIDYKEALECVDELHLGPQLNIFVRIGVESTLERSQSSRDHMGQLLLQLVQRGILQKAQFYKGFEDILEQADDMAIDIPHFWLYLAQLLSPVLKEGGFSMKELFSELSKPLLPAGSAGILISQILHVLCKEQSQQTVASLWRESGLSWTDVLPEGEDVQTFITQQQLQFVQPESSAPRDAPSETLECPEELIQQLERLLQKDGASNQQILDWIEANVDEPQQSSSSFLRALVTAVCKVTLKGGKPICPLDTIIFKERIPLLLKYLKSDVGKQLQALYALQALNDSLGQPPYLLQMFFDFFYNWDLISSEGFNMWQKSRDPAEQHGRDAALKAVTPFFTFMRRCGGAMETRN